MNDVAAISLTHGAELFVFNYAHADVADTFVFQNGGWGQFRKLGAEVGTTIRPGFGSDGVSVPSAAVVSIPLFHLDAYTSAHIRWDGVGVTISYTLDGSNWISVAEAGAVALNPATNPDLDIRVEFAGNVQDDPAVLNSLSVYVLRTDTLVSASGNRTGAFTADALTDDGIQMTNGSLLVAPDTTNLPTSFASVEFWARIDAATANGVVLFDSANANTSVTFTSNKAVKGSAVTVYADGALLDTATASKYLDGNFHHFVVNFSAPVNIAFGIARSFGSVTPAPVTAKIVATYPTALSAADIASIYTSGIGPAPIRVNDSGVISVTQPVDSAKVYSYPWSIASGTAK